MATTKINGITFEIKNNTRFSDSTVKRHFKLIVEQYGGGAEYYAKEQGTKIKSHDSSMRGEKMVFYSIG